MVLFIVWGAVKGSSRGLLSYFQASTCLHIFHVVLLVLAPSVLIRHKYTDGINSRAGERMTGDGSRNTGVVAPTVYTGKRAVFCP